MSKDPFHHRVQYDRSLNGGETAPLALDDDPGSGWVGAALNLTSSIVGAGCIGLGGAIAHSGGLVSLVAMVVFAVLSKFSFDLVVELSTATEPSSSLAAGAGDDYDEARATMSTYESLGFATYGNAGKMSVILCKGLYSFGCLVAYIVIVKDNFALALAHLLYGDHVDHREQGALTKTVGTLEQILTNQYFVTILFCTSVMLPLSMLRDVAPLERFSALKIIVVVLIVFFVMYRCFVSDDRQKSADDFANHWLVIHGGVFERSVHEYENGSCFYFRMVVLLYSLPTLPKPVR